MPAPEQPPQGESPPPTEAETTSPLPRVPAAPPPEHATVGLPLLDLLAPEQPPGSQPPGSQSPGPQSLSPQPPGSQPPSPQPPDYEPQPDYGQQPGYHQQPDYEQQPGYGQQPGYDQQPAYPQESGYDQQSGYQQQAAYQQQPAYPQQSGYDQQPGHQQPGYQQPGYQQPGYQQPGYQQPGYQQYQPAPPRRPRRRLLLGRPGAKLVLAVATGVLVLALLGIWALSSSTPKRRTAAPSSAGPTTSAVRVAGGYRFTQSAARADTDCVANSYGKVAEFFQSTPCTGLERTLYTSTVDGRSTVVSVSVVRMPNEQAATELQKLTDANGTGNVADLLRAGVQVPGGPDKLTDAGYASARDGTTVIIVEADYADPAASNEAQLDEISKAALQLRK